MKYLTIMLISFSIASAYLPNSFRNISTAGIFDDDYDLMLDPGRINEIDGYRVYTNLSNLVTGLERPFVNSSINYFLVGGSGPITAPLIGDKYGGTVFDFYSLNEPLATGLLTREGDTIFGEGEVVNTEWLDLDGDGTYDYVINSKEYREAWNRDRDFNLYLGLALKDKRYGVAFIHEDNKVESINPSANFKIADSESSLVDNRLTYFLGDTLETSDQQKGSSNSLLFSGWFGEDRLLNFQLGFGLRSLDSLTESNGFTYEDRNPGGDTLDYMKITTADTAHLPYSGFEIPARIGIRKEYDDGSEREYYLYLRYTSLGVAGNGEHVGYSLVDSTCRPGTVNSYDSTQALYSGSRKEYAVGLYGQHTYALSERFSLGFGLGLWNISSDSELQDSTYQSGSYVYDDGDGTPTANDSTVTYNEMHNWRKKTTATVRSVVIPIGMEFKAIDPVTFRLGAQHTTSYVNMKTTDNLISFDPRVTRTEYGDGSFAERIDDTQMQSGTSETDSPTMHTTDFFYGIGVDFGNNLQLDFMYFNNLVNLANWRLSATLKF